MREGNWTITQKEEQDRNGETKLDLQPNSSINQIDHFLRTNHPILPHSLIGYNDHYSISHGSTVIPSPLPSFSLSYSSPHEVDQGNWVGVCLCFKRDFFPPSQGRVRREFRVKKREELRLEKRKLWNRPKLVWQGTKTRQLWTNMKYVKYGTQNRKEMGEEVYLASIPDYCRHSFYD